MVDPIKSCTEVDLSTPVAWGDQNSANVCPCTCRKRKLILGYKLSYTTQGRLTVNYRYTHRKFQLKFSAVLKDYDLKCAENSKKKNTEQCYRF